MNDNDYHASPRIGSSGLKLMRKSPLHYWSEYLDPNRIRTETDALRFGRALHTFIFERDGFADKTVIEPSHYLTKAQCGIPIEEQKALFAENAKGKTIISLNDFETIKAMDNAIRSHPAANLLLRHGNAEKALLYDHPLTGSPSKIKPDWESVEHNGLIVDLKSAEDASPEAFGRSVVKYGYDLQAAWYLDGYLSVHGVMPKGFVFIAVEKKKPFGVAVYYVPPEVVNLGRRKYEPLLEQFEWCRQNNEWPCYSDNIQPLTLPGWAFK
jgi:hypothetical protein